MEAMRSQHCIPDWIEDKIVVLSVGWLNRLQHKERTKENYETITFTLDEYREPNICHAFIALKDANRAWHRAVLRFMERWHIVRRRWMRNEIDLIQFAPRTFRLAGTTRNARISTRREWARDFKRPVFESYITVSSRELTEHKELWTESAPNTRFCEWEKCVKIVSKDWEDSEKNSKHLSDSPQEEGGWPRAALVFWKGQNRNMSAANNEYKDWLNKEFEEQEQRMKKQEKPNK